LVGTPEVTQIRNSSKIQISSWHQEPAIPVADLSTRRYRGSTSLIGVAGTLLLHALALQSALLGTRVQKVRVPEVQGPGATLIQAETEPAETLILLDLPRASMTGELRLEESASRGLAPRNMQVTVISPDATPHVDIPAEKLDESESSEATVDSGDPASRAMLFGRYTGQINARIERAWRRPRTPVNSDAGSPREPESHTSGVPLMEDTFRCQVRIIQDGHGVVQEIQLLSCNGSLAWQRSLIAAILMASPLPAPPSPTVFTHTLTMSFEGLAYNSTRLADEYELEERPSMLAAKGGAMIVRPENSAAIPLESRAAADEKTASEN
jgi:hypothetical protein